MALDGNVKRMTHLAILSMFLAIPLGIAAIIKLFQFYNRYQYNYLQTYGYILIITSIQLGITIINNYIQVNVFPRFISVPAVLSESIYRLLEIGLQLIWSYLVLILCFQILEIPISKIIKKIYTIVAIIIGLVSISLTIYSMFIVNVLPILFGYMIFVFSLLIFGTVIGFRFLMLNQKQAVKDKRKADRIFGLIFFVPLAILIILGMIHLSNKLNNDYLVLFSSLHIIALFGAVLIFLKKYMILYHGQLDGGSPSLKNIESLFKKYKLSKREEEVVQLICKGATNQEVADKLYLSLLTIKGYVFKIYQKTGVKNRVQLTNLFKGY